MKSTTYGSLWDGPILAKKEGMNLLTVLPGHISPAPLDLAAMLGPAAWARLPAAVRRRFAAGHAATAFAGRMDLRCSRLGRFMAWLAWPLCSPLVADCLDDVPAEVVVQPDSEGGVIWSRRMGGRTVRSVKQAHPDGGVLERTAGGLAMALDVLEDDGCLVFQSRHYAWCWGPVYLRLPQALSPGVCRVEHRDLGGNQFRFSLAMTHPWWGETFHQTGVFDDRHEEAAHVAD